MLRGNIGVGGQPEAGGQRRPDDAEEEGGSEEKRPRGHEWSIREGLRKATGKEEE